MSSTILSNPLKLPCGATLPNRLCKAAMTEGLADKHNRATEELCRLYRAWSQGGTGLLLTGNVQIDRRYMERPGNVAIDGKQDDEQLMRLRDLATAATSAGNHCWVQLGHAGRQQDIQVEKHGVAPSAINFGGAAGYGALLKPSYKPRELSTDEVQELPQRFADAALICKQVGFTGVQLHSAHGYLLSSFLNPNANHRSDRYGGPLENRARLLIETIRSVRKAVGPAFPVSVKINSSDFQKGGFTHDDAIEVAAMLDREGIDLLEISGGNYENPVLLAGEKLDTTYIREAYFLKYAEGIRARLKQTPLMVTGGMRSRSCMEQAIENAECDVIGVGRPLCGMPDASSKLLSGKIDSMPRYENDLDVPIFLAWLKNFKLGRLIRHFLIQFWYYHKEVLVGKEGAEGLRDVGLLSAFFYIDSWDRRQAASLEGLPACRGTVLNTNSSRWKFVCLGFVVAAVLVMRNSP